MGPPPGRPPAPPGRLRRHLAGGPARPERRARKEHRPPAERRARPAPPPEFAETADLYHTERAAEKIRAKACRAGATDAGGKFTLGVVPGAKWQLNVTRGKRTFRTARKIEGQVAPGKTLDLGDVTINLEAAGGQE